MPLRNLRRNVEDNIETSWFHGRGLNASTPLWQHDNPWIRLPSRTVRSSWKFAVKRVLSYFKSLDFLTHHYIYFITTTLVCSVIFWRTADSSRPIDYTDALFTCVSAMGGTGLRTVELSTLNSVQQSILFVLLILGHAVVISMSVLLLRMKAFHSKFGEKARERSRAAWSASMLEPDISLDGHESASSNISLVEPDGGLASKEETNNTIRLQTHFVAVEAVPDPPDDDQIRWFDDDQVTLGSGQPRHNANRVFPMVGVGARLDLNNHPPDFTPNLSLFKLTPTECKEMGGVEYRAVRFLICIVAVYWLMFTIIGMISMGTWVSVNHANLARSNGLSPFWTGAFLAVSAFVNSGFSLLDMNMTAFQTSIYPLLTLGLLILAGKTLYPCLLRFFIWIMRRIMPARPSWGSWKATLDFVLDHPRRMYTDLFPSSHTWYLLGSVIILNGISWALFGILSIEKKEIQSLPAGYRVLDGLFQALCVRFGGFYVVNIPNIQQGLLALYVAMMYIPANPVVVEIRNATVYEEHSLGVYEPNDRKPNIFLSLIRHYLLNRRYLHTTEESHSYFLHQQLRFQFGNAIWWPVLGIILIMIAESDHVTRQPLTYPAFNIIFEVFSAYSCVGISMGFPGKNYSFCGSWHPISKLILAVVILLGRHRDLPVAIDQAVMLPSDSLAFAEEEDAALRREQTRVWGVGNMQV